MIITLKKTGDRVRVLGAGSMIRKGKCKKCGWCCRFHPTSPPGVPYPNIMNKLCAHLHGYHNNSKCSIYDKRPMGCVLFPLPGHETGPLCGYKWAR
ncbi:hypothetical protein LCGC14_1231210 [marine sediment metagenome]|uniref:YkgJ family cysteine cluster protein n=1 Tax=marine sediment metagenome TaxID=412755 RepID=A0A0F9LCL9_9ZZZZ